MVVKPFRWQPLLQPNELLLWQGRPYTALSLIAPTQAEWLIGGLGAISVAALVILDQSGLVGGPGGWIMVALLIAALMVTGIPFRQMRQRSNALKRRNYAVTDRRVLVVPDSRRPDALQSWPLPASAKPVLERERHHLSTLHFGGNSPRMTHLRDADKVAHAITLGRAAEEKMRNR